MAKNIFSTWLTFSKMADHGADILNWNTFFSIFNTEDFQFFLDIFTSKLEIGVNFFQSHLYDEGHIFVQSMCCLVDIFGIYLPGSALYITLPTTSQFGENRFQPCILLALSCFLTFSVEEIQYICDCRLITVHWHEMAQAELTTWCYRNVINECCAFAICHISTHLINIHVIILPLGHVWISILTTRTFPTSYQVLCMSHYCGAVSYVTLASCYIYLPARDTK